MLRAGGQSTELRFRSLKGGDQLASFPTKWVLSDSLPSGEKGELVSLLKLGNWEYFVKIALVCY